MNTERVIKKLGLTKNLNAAMLNSPAGFMKTISEAFDNNKIKTSLNGKFNYIQVFVHNKAHINKYLPKVIKSINENGII